MAFRDRLTGTDLVLTGEGKLDGQSVRGKVCLGVARAARAAGVPAIALVGAVGEGARLLRDEGPTAWFSLCDRPLPPDRALRDAAPLLESLAEQVVRCFDASR